MEIKISKILPICWKIIFFIICLKIMKNILYRYIMICAPGKYDPENKTCFSKGQLTALCEAYNKYIERNKNMKNLKPIELKDDKKFLLKELTKRFEDVCHDEYCLTKQKFMDYLAHNMKKDIIDNNFLPIGPSQQTEWLSSVDINSLMQKYEKVYPDFKFLGAIPLDCDELSYCSLYHLNFGKYHEKNVKYLAMIFNLDRHYQSGSHWVVVFIEFPVLTIEFCDSTGHKPKDNISKIIANYQSWVRNKFKKEAVVKINDNKYQLDNSECGVYCCNYIIRRLAGEKFEDIVNHSLNFKEINSCRNVYFQNKKSTYKINEKCDPRYGIQT